MSSTDGGLRTTFREKLPEFHWQSVESGMTGSGIPDANACYDGVEFWTENKLCHSNAVGIDKFQVSWHERRARAGGRTFICVRLEATEGPRKGGARDELWIFRGSDIRAVFLEGLQGARPLLVTEGGKAKWLWASVRETFLHSRL